MKANVSIDEALLNPKLLGAALGDPRTWQEHRVYLKAAFGLALNRDEAPAFASVAGSRAPPARRVRELWAIIGRRGGKSRMAAAIAVYVALFVKHKLAPGEIGTVLVLSASLDQSRIVFSYCLAFLEASPVLRKEILNVTADEITLRSGLVNMAKFAGKRTPSTIVNRTVPRRAPNSELRPREYLTEKEIERLQETARKRSRHGHRDATMILVAYRHGLRASEVCGLRWDQIDLSSGRLHVRRAKGGIDNVHPLSGSA